MAQVFFSLLQMVWFLEPLHSRDRSASLALNGPATMALMRSAQPPSLFSASSSP